MGIKELGIRAVNKVLGAVPSPWAGKAWGIDVYDPAVMKFQPGDIDFCVIRMGGMGVDKSGRYIVYKNPNFAEQVQAVWDCGAIPMAYWVINPDYYWRNEYTAGSFANIEDDKDPVMIAMKEQLHAGSGWKKVGGVYYDLETAGNPAWEAMIVDSLRGRIRNQQSKNEFPKLIQGGYSRKSWIESTNPSRAPIKTLFENQPGLQIWTSNYLTAFPARHSPIVEKRVNELPLTTQKPIWFGDNPAKPKEHPRIWQYHGTAPNVKYSTCPEVTDKDGKPMGLDLNVMECTRAELFALVGWSDPLTGPPPPPPPDEPPPAELAEILARIDTLEDNQLNHERRVSDLEAWRERVRAA